MAPWWRTAALALALGIAAAACSGSAAVTPPPSPSPTPVATPAPTDTPAPSDAPSDTLQDSPSASAAAALDPCSLITPADIVKVAGRQLLTPMPEGDPVSRCTWPTPTSGEVAQIDLDLGDGALKQLQIDRDVLKHTFKPVPGVGDEAWAEDDAVFLRVGTTWVGLHLTRLNDPAQNAAPLAALAAAIAGRVAGG